MTRVAVIIAAALGTLLMPPANAQDAEPQLRSAEPPPISITRWAEDYRTFGEANAPLAGLDRFKWIPLTEDGDVALTLGGSLREQFESYQNREFGFAEGDDDVYVMHRLLLHADLRIGTRARVFAELGNALIPGRDVMPSPVDENELDLTQGFVDLMHAGDAMGARLRFGRQELPFGSGRLVALRDGPNNRLSFDAARVTIADDRSRFDAFLAAPVELRPGVFDDRFNDDVAFWGAYGTLPNPFHTDSAVDLYYFGIDRVNRRFGGAVGNETRHSIGARLFGDHNGFDYNIEAVGQLGTIGDGDILAWTVATDVGHTWSHLDWRPRLGLRTNISSGARGAGETTETFDPLFPNNSYFSEAAVLSPSNLIDVNPAVTIRPTDRLEILALWDFVWLTSDDDAAYGPPGVPLFDPDDSEGRFVGHSLSLKSTYQFDRHSSLTLAYTHFFAGTAVTSAGGDDIDYLALWYEFKL